MELGFIIRALYMCGIGFFVISCLGIHRVVMSQMVKYGWPYLEYRLVSKTWSEHWGSVNVVLLVSESFNGRLRDAQYWTMKRCAFSSGLEVIANKIRLVMNGLHVSVWKASWGG